MRIETSPQTRTGYRKTPDTAPSKTFQQVMQTRSQDHYVPGVRSQPAQTEMEFSRAERNYGGVTVSNATHAKLKQLAEMDAKADYTGMSADEIYAEIWNRYNEVFDGDMVVFTACIAGPAEWGEINNQFVREITKHVYNPELRAARAERDAFCKSEGRPYSERSYEERMALTKSFDEKAHEICRNARMKALGYYGMSIDEREAAIKEKYAGKNTHMDFLRMQSELKCSGVLADRMGEMGASSYCFRIDHLFELAYNPNCLMRVDIEKSDFMTADQWYRVANQPLDMEKFAASMKELQSHSTFHGYPANIETILEDAIDRYIGGTIENGIDRLMDDLKP